MPGTRSQSLKLTARFFSENRQKPKTKGESSNHHFSAVFAVSFREGK